MTTTTAEDRAAEYELTHGVAVAVPGPCPACGLDSIYSRDQGRYLHIDGSDNKRCWAHISSGAIDDGPIEPESVWDFLDNVPGSRQVVVTRGSAITPAASHGGNRT